MLIESKSHFAVTSRQDIFTAKMHSVGRRGVEQHLATPRIPRNPLHCKHIEHLERMMMNLVCQHYISV